MTNQQNIELLLLESNLLSVGKSYNLHQFAGDGSDRQFFRCTTEDNNRFIVILPADNNPGSMAEARASFAIGRHLYDSGLPVPQPCAFEKQKGILIFADLGNTLLFDALNKSTSSSEKILLYRRTLEQLAAFQIKGRQGFNLDWCWDTRHYDQELMLERESHYFKREFCQRYMGIPIPANLENNFLELAAKIHNEPADFLLHRDFQSRNIMIIDGEPHIIDFQGARLGPLGYDLASLLNDPYINLAEEIKEELIKHYINAISHYINIDADAFLSGYYHIALQRNLQVLGAYAFLTLEKKKTFFNKYIIPASNNLIYLLTGKLAGIYPDLQKLAQQVDDKLQARM